VDVAVSWGRNGVAEDAAAESGSPNPRLQAVASPKQITGIPLPRRIHRGLLIHHLRDLSTAGIVPPAINGVNAPVPVLTYMPFTL
jgi:hypothetical protein